MRDFEQFKERLGDICEGWPGNLLLAALVGQIWQIVRKEQRSNQVIGIAYLGLMAGSWMNELHISTAEVSADMDIQAAEAEEKILGRAGKPKPDWKAQFR